jgi:hypothetical protein
LEAIALKDASGSFVFVPIANDDGCCVYQCELYSCREERVDGKTLEIRGADQNVEKKHSRRTSRQETENQQASGCVCCEIAAALSMLI